VFPLQYLGGCNRTFRYAWLEENPWLVYSEHVDGMFCIFCSIVCKDTSKGYFSNLFRVWNKKSEKTKEHVRLAYYQKCMELADNFKIEHADTTITAKYDAYVVANIKRNHNLWLAQYCFVVGNALLFEMNLTHLVTPKIFLHC